MIVLDSDFSLPLCGQTVSDRLIVQFRMSSALTSTKSLSFPGFSSTGRPMSIQKLGGCPSFENSVSVDVHVTDARVELTSLSCNKKKPIACFVDTSFAILSFCCFVNADFGRHGRVWI